MLLATRLSDAAKKPTLRLIACGLSSGRPSRDFHSAISACMETSVGIQWLLQAARYLSHAQRYFSGKSWFTSARQLIIAFSSMETRPPFGAVILLSVSGQSSIVFFSPLEHIIGWSTIMLQRHIVAYWQASQVGSSIAQALPHGSGETAS